MLGKKLTKRYAGGTKIVAHQASFITLRYGTFKKIVKGSETKTEAICYCRGCYLNAENYKS